MWLGMGALRCLPENIQRALVVWAPHTAATACARNPIWAVRGCHHQMMKPPDKVVAASQDHQPPCQFFLTFQLQKTFISDADDGIVIYLKHDFDH
jgi:hypothetical protein